MPYILLPAHSERAATHRRDSDSALFRVIDVSAAAVEGDTSRLVATLDGLTPIPAQPVRSIRPRELSKLTIRRRIRSLGKEAVFDATLDSVTNARADWDDAIVIRTDDPLFTTHRAAFQQALGLTDAQMTELLA